MQEIKVNIRVPEAYHEDFRKIGNNTSQNAIQAISGYIELRRYTMRELKGVFSAAEIKYLVDMSNSSMFLPEYASNLQMLIARVEDANKFDGLADKWQVNLDIMLDKIKKLTSAQVFFLQFACYNYWYGSDDVGDLDSFVNDLTN